jgi:hypothetical protein
LQHHARQGCKKLAGKNSLVESVYGEVINQLSLLIKAVKHKKNFQNDKKDCGHHDCCRRHCLENSAVKPSM